MLILNLSQTFLIWLLFITGLRFREAQAIEWETDIDLSLNEYNIFSNVLNIVEACMIQLCLSQTHFQ